MTLIHSEVNEGQMGRPFAKEIAELEHTYKWACAADISKISRTLLSTWDLPLIAIGSGGSFSAAELQASRPSI